MKSTALLTSIALLAAVGSTPLLAGSHGQDRNPHRDRQQSIDARPSGSFDHGMQAVSNSANPDQQGYGWRYFSDPAARRAIVISPQGHYYFSHGKGLRWIAAQQSSL